eukprot:3022850-Lingulodinium_polyedra.AAC.1
MSRGGYLSPGQRGGGVRRGGSGRSACHGGRAGTCATSSRDVWICVAGHGWQLFVEIDVAACNAVHSRAARVAFGGFSGRSRVLRRRRLLKGKRGMVHGRRNLGGDDDLP